MQRGHALSPTALCSLLLALGALTPHAGAQGDTAFTYQGELTENGVPAEGPFDMQFQLWTAEVGGTQAGGTQTLDGVQVSGGRFAAAIDFGPNFFVFNNDPRWLQIIVRGTPLSPRQALTRTPYAIQTRGINVNESEHFVGIGRKHPLDTWEYFGISAPTDFFGGMYVETDPGGKPLYGYATDGEVKAYHYFDDAFDTWRLNVFGDVINIDRNTHNTGIGYRFPEAALHVADSGATHALNVAEDFFIDPTLNLTTVNRSARVTSAEFFGVHAPVGADTYGGMYISTTSEGAWPFYGYAAGETPDMWTYYDGSDGDWHVWNGGHRLTVESSGRVGIGDTNPAFTLEVNGSAGKPGGGSWSSSSDARLKKNIRTIDGALESLLRLRGVTFEYKDPDSINELHGRRTGVVAQEVERFFPDWVDEREDGYKTVTFRGFEALAVEALRDLREERDAEIARQSEQIRDLERRVTALERLMALTLTQDIHEGVSR